MAAVIEHSFISRPHLTDEPVSINATRDRFTSVAVDVITKMVADCERRNRGYRDDQSLLNRGYFSANEYMQMLKDSNQSKRLEWLINSGNLYHGFTTSKCFLRKVNKASPSGIEVNHYTIKPDVAPSEAIGSLKDSLNLFGCGEFVQIAYLEALRVVLGDEKFDALLNAKTPHPLVIHYNSPENPLISLMIPAQKGRMKKGQIYHFQNLSLYPYKHLNGESAGLNCLCIDDTPGQERFIGLGFSSEGMTMDQIKDLLYKQFNDPSLGCSMMTQDLGKSILRSLLPQQRQLNDYCEKIELTPEEISELKRENIPDTLKQRIETISKLACSSLSQARQLFLDCGNVKQVFHMNAERIYQLASSTTEKACELFREWSKEFSSKPAKG